MGAVDCQKCGNPATDYHHVIYRCNGGHDGRENLIPLCKSCHTEHHSKLGDFSRWGRLGGKASASKLYFLWTLKQFRDSWQRRYEWVLANIPHEINTYKSLEIQKTGIQIDLLLGGVG